MTHLASVLGGQINAWPCLQSCDAHVQSVRAADGSDAPVRVLARASHHLGRTGIRSDHSSCDPRCVGLLAGCSCGWRSSLYDRGQHFRSYLSPTAGWSTRHQIIVCREQRRSLTSYAVHIVTCAQHEANATCLPTRAGAGAPNGVTASASRCNSRALVVPMADRRAKRSSRFVGLPHCVESFAPWVLAMNGRCGPKFTADREASLRATRDGHEANAKPGALRPNPAGGLRGRRSKTGIG